MKITDRLGGRTDSGREGGGGRRTRGQAAVVDELFHSVYLEVVDRLDTRGAKDLDPAELTTRVAEAIELTLSSREVALSARQQRQLAQAVTDEILGLGPLEPLLADKTISDILVNGPERIYVERDGLIERTPVRFLDDEHLLNTINRIVAKIGRRIDEASPMVDARLPDGSRVNAIIPPLAIDGPALSIRRFACGPTSFKELAEKGTLTAAIAHYLRSATQAKCNILISGGTGAGKTTLLNAISGSISPRERIITIEDSAELRLQQEHIVRLETRPPNIERRGEVSIRDLVRNALRMRPDRIIIGEVRAEEVLDMVQAMNTGHEGSMTTVHANGVEDAFTRLMSMMMMAKTQLSEPLMRQMLARAIHVVVHVGRESDGRRCVTEIAEVTGIADNDVAVNRVFTLDRVARYWRCSGRSVLLARFEQSGAPLDPRVLRTER